MITVERMEAALNYLAQTDEVVAEAKVQVAKSEYLAKLEEAFGFRLASGATVKDREVAAKTDSKVQELWNIHFKAVADYEKLRAKRERAVLTIDLFRTLEASRRQGSQVT